MHDWLLELHFCDGWRIRESETWQATLTLRIYIFSRNFVGSGPWDAVATRQYNIWLGWRQTLDFWEFLQTFRQFVVLPPCSIEKISLISKAVRSISISEINFPLQHNSKKKHPRFFSLVSPVCQWVCLWPLTFLSLLSGAYFETLSRKSPEIKRSVQESIWQTQGVVLFRKKLFFSQH